MKLKDYRDGYYTHSGSASTVARQIAFAGIALIWIFKSGTNGQYVLPSQLLWPALFLVSGLTLDLLQYVFAAAIWGTFARYKEKKGVTADTNLSAPACFNWPALVCFWGKVISVVAAYLLLFAYVKSAIQFY